MQTRTPVVPPRPAPREPGVADNHRPRRWRWLIWLVAVLVLVGALVGGLAWLGMLPSRGPMYEGPYQAGGVTAGMNVRAGRPIGYSSLWVYNPSRVDVTLDSIEPVAGDANVRVVEAWLPVDTPRCQGAAVSATVKPAPDRCKLPIDGYVLPRGTPLGQGPRLVVVLQANKPGTYRSGGFAIHYHMGPIHYTSLYSNGFVLHVRPDP